MNLESRLPVISPTPPPVEGPMPAATQGLLALMKKAAARTHNDGDCTDSIYEKHKLFILTYLYIAHSLEQHSPQ
jgi:hypothetical protein